MSAVAIIPLLVQLSEPGLTKVENSLKRSNKESMEPVLLALDIMASNEMPMMFYRSLLSTSLSICSHLLNWFLFKEFMGFEPVMLGLSQMFRSNYRLFWMVDMDIDYTKVIWPFQLNCLILRTGPSGHYAVQGPLCQLPTHAVLQDFFLFLWIEGLISAAVAAIHVLVILTLLFPCHRKSYLLHKAPHQARRALHDIVWKLGPNDYFVVLKLQRLLPVETFTLFCHMFKRRGGMDMTEDV